MAEQQARTDIYRDWLDTMLERYDPEDREMMRILHDSDLLDWSAWRQRSGGQFVVKLGEPLSNAVFYWVCALGGFALGLLVGFHW